MRDHYEGTPLDISKDFGAGPYHTPYRLSPLSFKVNGQEYFNERPISTQQSGFVFVSQMRSTMPDAIGGVLWFGTIGFPENFQKKGKKIMKVLLAGGGTAGHINPALAIAGYIKNKRNDAEFLFIGNRGGMEQRLVPQAGFEIKSITISGFKRSFSPKSMLENVKTVSRTFTSSREAKKIIAEFKPDICIGTGGYVSGPVIRTAAKMGIPCIIHEQNAYPGITNKMLAKSVKKVMLAVPDAKKYFDKNVDFVITGNPVRQEILTAKKEESRKEHFFFAVRDLLS